MEGFGLILRDMDFKKVFCGLCIGLFMMTLGFTTDDLWRADHGNVQFKSDAPLELIAAESNALRGLINPSTKGFAFTLRINSFEGFNSDIQQTHFLENYLEEKKYPQATFDGKFIEDIPFHTPGDYTVRAKGNLNIHGVIKERIIKGTLHITNTSARLETQFTVPLTDHGIIIPKIVMQKIAEEIDVNIDIGFMWDKV
jgi:hypothetical protein